MKITKKWLTQERKEIKKLEKRLMVFEKVGESPKTIETLKTAIDIRVKRLARKELEYEKNE